MHRKLAVAFLFISSISCAKNSVNLCELVDHIKNHSCSLEREKAFNDLRKAGIAAAATIACGVAFCVVKKMWEAPRVVTTTISDTAYTMDTVSSSLPLWVIAPWVLAEVAGAGYAAIKGCQGAKHLVFPDHKIVVSKVEEITKEKAGTHIRVKRENE